MYTVTRYLALLLLPIAAFLAFAFAPAPAVAETPGCVTHGEFDDTHAGMSVQQVANAYDDYGNYIGDQGNNQRRAYPTCWATGERRVIVEFSYNSGDSVDWYIRDV